MDMNQMNYPEVYKIRVLVTFQIVKKSMREKHGRPFMTNTAKMVYTLLSREKEREKEKRILK
jgi:uncharacterized protein (DUF433 family)